MGTDLMDPATEAGDETDGQMITLDGSAALAALNRSEIDMQISTAKEYPRSLTKVHRDAMTLATLDEETAATMFYVLPRSGKKIEGPSIRLAEVIGSCWGNLRYASRVVSIDPPKRRGEPQFITAQGMCHDLEKNVAIAWECKRRITNKNGERFNDDMIQVTGNAAAAVALREAIFKVVPRALIKPIYEAAKQTAIGKAESMDVKRSKAIGHFAKMGVDEPRVLAALGVKGVEDIGVDELVILRGLATAIKDGETTVDDAFAVHQEGNGKAATRSALNDKPAPKIEKAPEKPAAPAPAADESTQPEAPEESQEAPSIYDAPLETLKPQIGSLLASLGRAGVKNLGQLDELLGDETRCKDVLSQGEATKARKALAEAVAKAGG